MGSNPTLFRKKKIRNEFMDRELGYVLSEGGYALQRLDKGIFDHRKAIGYVEQWDHLDDKIKIRVSTGLKRDVSIAASRWVQGIHGLLNYYSGVQGLPFHYSNEGMDSLPLGDIVYDLEYLLREVESQRWGAAGHVFGISVKGFESSEYKLDKEVVYAEPQYITRWGGTVFRYCDVYLYMPKGQSLSYYSKMVNYKRFRGSVSEVREGLYYLSNFLVELDSVKVLNVRDSIELDKGVSLMLGLLVKNLRLLYVDLHQDSWSWRSLVICAHRYCLSLSKLVRKILSVRRELRMKGNGQYGNIIVRNELERVVSSLAYKGAQENKLFFGVLGLKGVHVSKFIDDILVEALKWGEKEKEVLGFSGEGVIRENWWNTLESSDLRGKLPVGLLSFPTGEKVSTVSRRSLEQPGSKLERVLGFRIKGHMEMLKAGAKGSDRMNKKWSRLGGARKSESLKVTERKGSGFYGKERGLRRPYSEFGGLVVVEMKKRNKK